MKSNNLGSPVANSTAELIDSEGELNVKYRLHQWCCGSKRRLLIILLVSLLVVGAVATLTYFLTRSKCEAKDVAVKCLFMHQILVRFHACVPQRIRIPCETRASGRLASCFDSPVVTSSSSPSSKMLS